MKARLVPDLFNPYSKEITYTFFNSKDTAYDVTFNTETKKFNIEKENEDRNINYENWNEVVNYFIKKEKISQDDFKILEPMLVDIFNKTGVRVKESTKQTKEQPTLIEKIDSFLEEIKVESKPKKEKIMRESKNLTNSKNRIIRTLGYIVSASNDINYTDGLGFNLIQKSDITHLFVNGDAVEDPVEIEALRSQILSILKKGDAMILKYPNISYKEKLYVLDDEDVIEVFFA